MNTLSIIFQILLIIFPTIFISIYFYLTKQRKCYDITSQEKIAIKNWAEENGWNIRDENKYFVLKKHNNNCVYIFKIFPNGSLFSIDINPPYMFLIYDRIKINKETLSNISNKSIRNLLSKNNENN
jgi:hypothetical protein